ncbi:putative Phage portal protein, lambda family [Bosea sp. LC85]|uniref:phage portal protein n=1 Tax=Bosea sp. LC85 TaxID=1502851 RepID=UPI0004E2D491|nr:phage portal protein [Bosea sp. LC85]KFC63986.1 putative Phage portal protein, lambda family [Bosea sp. LC85]
MTSEPLLDRALAALAPGLAVRRAEARLRLAALRNATAAYDGASRGHRTQGRKIGSTSADGEALTSLRRLRDVARDMERNNPYAQRGLSVIPTNVVGTGIVPSVIGAGDRSKKKLEGLIKAHLETTAVDFDGRQTYAGLQFTAVRALARDGEVLAVRYTPKASAGLPVPFQVRLLEADYLDDGKTGPEGDGYCVQGIEFDAQGRRIAYWLFEEHPGAVSSNVRRSQRSKRVPAADVAHLYRVDRPGQSRGVPWLAPAMMTLWDLKDYEEAELVRQKVAACFAAFETDPTAASSIGGAINGTTKAASPVDVLEPGMIHKMAPGHTISFASPPQVQGYADYIRMNLRKVASSLGVPFNEIASDDSQENFASSRRGYLVFQRLIEVWRWQAVIPQFCDPVGRWFLEAATVPLGGPPRGAMLDHTPPRRELISPKEEVPMMRDMIRSGLMTRSETLRSLGYEPEAVEAEFKSENERADKAELSFDSDGRRPATGPVVQQPETQP